MRRYKSYEIRMNQFIQLPKELYGNKRYKHISNDAKVLYGFLLDRLELSRKNKWINKNGEIYLIFTREEVQNLINISSKTATKIFKELKEVELIQEHRQGLNKPNLIYIGHIIYDDETEKCLKRKIYESRSVSNSELEREYSPLINTNINNTNINNTDNINLSSKKSIVKKEEPYCTKENKEIVDRKIDFLQENTMGSYSKYDLKKFLNRANGDEELVMYVYDNVMNSLTFILNEEPIRNLVGYILKCIDNEIEFNSDKYA